MTSAPAASVIRFYSTRDLPHGCFSNFSQHALVAKGLRWATSEHYFQAMKFFPHSPTDVDAVQRSRTAAAAAAIGRDRSRPIRKDWDAVKDDIMYDTIMLKFTQNPDIQAVLLQTDGHPLVEHTDKDAYWGDGGDGSGRNKLGITLMGVRDALLRNDRSLRLEDAATVRAADSKGGAAASRAPASKRVRSTVATENDTPPKSA